MIGSKIYSIFKIQASKKLSSGYSLHQSRLESILCGSRASTQLYSPFHVKLSSILLTLTALTQTNRNNKEKDISNKIIEDFFSLESIGICKSELKLKKKSRLAIEETTIRLTGKL